MNMNTKKTTFQHANQSSRFSERVVGEKMSQNRPHFERYKRDGKAHFKQDKRAGRPFEKKALTPSVRTVTECTMENAGGRGQVKVVVKRSENDAVRAKKTGPLSPRAPEKIKKNRQEEMKVYGENACLALFAQRPESIVRVWTTVEMAHCVGDLFRYLAANKKVYHVVDTQELALVSGSEHHGGICMLVKKSRPFTLSGYLDIPRNADCLVLLNKIHNTYNIGGIVRTCAYYGVKGVIVEDGERLNSAVAMRVAEGGMEYIRPLQINTIPTALQQLRQAGYQIVHLTNNKQATDFAKVRLENKVVFVLSDVPDDNLVQDNDVVANLSYANPLKHGLNVAVACGVVLAKWTMPS
ncbi:TrmH family RNA methyltransferase [Actinobacillus seminis]|uniref:TrmH family RNA methyltransferase n=1 Tax=Actinobacillus seminis TaxID=722 RepID=UPI003B967720